MKIQFCGGTKVVTGSCYFLESDKGEKILLDCGLFQGSRDIDEYNLHDFPFKPSEIKAVILSHAHLDHCGRLPKLVKQGFTGKIYCTPPTRELSKIILEDALEVAPTIDWSHKNLEKTLALFQDVLYHQETKIGDSFSFQFLDAGHILGSAITTVNVDGKKLAYSGDLGNCPNPILPDYEIPMNVDYLIVESTYGDREHGDASKVKDVLEDAIEEAVIGKGTILIPSFAIERTQKILFDLNELTENSRVPNIPVFLDSTMAIRSTEVYRKYTEYFNKDAGALIKSGDDIFNFKNLTLALTAAESKSINNVPAPKVIIAGSGMSTGGRILHHEVRYLPDPHSALLFVNYQAQGTLGRALFDGAKEVRIFDEIVPVRAHLIKAQEYSAHADFKKLFKWVRAIGRPKNIFVVHGDREPAEKLAVFIRDNLGLETKAPDYEETFKAQ